MHLFSIKLEGGDSKWEIQKKRYVENCYMIMVHEKGFKISGRWNNHEQKKLLNDFAVMIQLIELEIDVSFGEIKQVVLYLKNADVHVENVLQNVLQRKDSDMMRFYGKANVKIDSKMLELIEKGERIIQESQKTKGLKRLVSEKKRKEQMWLILMGLHNLPRIYLDGEGEIDDLKKWLISQEEAFAYSSSYLTALIESEIKKNL